MAKLGLGDKAISFSLPGVDGRDHSLEGYSDKAVVAVIFSCNHCPYVQAWEGRMVALQHEYADKGVQLIAISSNDVKRYPADSFPKMKERAAQRNFSFPYVFDETQEVARTYGAGHTPEVFLFDQERSLRYHGAIDDNYDDPKAVTQHYLRDAIEAVLAGGEPAVASTPPVGCTIKWKL